MEIPFKTIKELLNAASNHDYGVDGGKLEKWLMKRLPEALRRGHLRKSELIEVARWKWRGGITRQLCGKNTEEEIREISSFAFSAVTERARYGTLLSLSGVGEPMASVILHFAFGNLYPILDIRAMTAAGGSRYWTFDRWQEYTAICQQAVRNYQVSMRNLDRALWVVGGNRE